MRRRCLFLFVTAALLAVSFPSQTVFAQTDGVLQINDDLHRFLLRMQTSGHLNNAFLTTQPLSGHEAGKYLTTLDSQRVDLSASDQRQLDLFLGRSSLPGAGKIHKAIPFFYENGRDAFELKGNDYAIQMNPLAYLSTGRASISSDRSPDSSRTITNNTRGFRASGHIGNSLFFETRLETRLEDIIYPDYAKKTAPRLGVIKYYRDKSQYDYFTVTGVVGYRSKYVDVRFGRDQNRWSQGLNSLLLSNYAPVYDHLQIRTTLGPFQYTNVFAAFNDQSSLPESFDDQVIPRKFGTFHKLSIKLPARFELEFFETVIAAPDSTKLRANGYDIAYLNPIIFYRAVEHDRGSPDNVLIGAGLSWLPFPSLFVYGQTIFDEFRFQELTSGDGWWANKWGVLAGLHVTPTSDVDARFEYARIQPFTYSHYDPAGSYSHNEDILGHQGGPNSENMLMEVNYRPIPRLEASLTFTRTNRGRDTDEINYGSDIREPNRTRQSDYGHSFLQGVSEKTLLLETRVGFEWLPSVFVEGGLRYQTIDDGELGVDTYSLPFLQLRWGLPFRYQRY